MVTLHDLAEDLWCGRTTTRDKEHHPFAAQNIIEEVADGVAFYKSFSNVTSIRTDDGLVLVDTGSFHPVAHQRSFDNVRSWNSDRLHTAVYTHGHVDHAYGLPPFLTEAESNGWTRPEIIGHECVHARMDRYIETAGFNTIINTRQFGHHTEWPTDPIYPTTTYETTMTLDIGGTTLELFHGRGETDDHTWVFLPETRVLCTGDFFIWAAPNAGNPQKVQRYCKEWAEVFRKMAARKPLVLLPGHGLPVYGEDRVQQALLDSAEYLESLYAQTLDLLNQGAGVDEIVHGVAPPAHLAERPYLLPIYDEPEFVVRNVYRCLAGWFGGVPSELKPAPLDEQGREILALAGGLEAILARAAELSESGNHRMASHLVDWAFHAEPESKDVRSVRAEVYRRRTEAESSTMSRGIFGAVAREMDNPPDWP